MNLRAINDGLTDIATDVEGADRAPTDGQRQVVAASDARYGKANAQWQQIRENDLAKLNQNLRSAGQAAVRVPAPDQIHREASEESEDMP
jgi:tyrosine-protein phosphatase YwqE